MTTTERMTMSATTLVGDSVRNPAGENLGEITELMIDVDTARIAYAVLDTGGFLGIGNSLHAIPWGALTLDTDNHEFVLDADKQRLESAPGFDKDNWPDFANREWGTTVHDHYGASPYWN